MGSFDDASNYLGWHLWRHLYPYRGSGCISGICLHYRKFVYKELDFEKIYKSMKETTLINGSLMFMIGLSIAFANYLSLAQIPKTLAPLLINLSDSPFVLLLIVNIFLLVIGCFIDNIPAVIILTPILLPIVTQVGIDPIQFGMIITFALAIGFVTPPYGINLFVACSISKKVLKNFSGPTAFIAVMIVCLMLLPTSHFNDGYF